MKQKASTEAGPAYGMGNGSRRVAGDTALLQHWTLHIQGSRTTAQISAETLQSSHTQGILRGRLDQPRGRSHLGTQLEVHHDNADLGAGHHEDDKDQEEKAEEVIELVLPDRLKQRTGQALHHNAAPGSHVTGSKPLLRS